MLTCENKLTFWELHIVDEKYYLNRERLSPMGCNCDSFPLDVASGVLPALESNTLLEVGLDLGDDKLVPGIHMWPFRVTTDINYVS